MPGAGHCAGGQAVDQTAPDHPPHPRETDVQRGGRCVLVQQSFFAGQGGAGGEVFQKRVSLPEAEDINWVSSGGMRVLLLF